MTKKATTAASAHTAPTIIHPVEQGVIPKESTLLITSPGTDARRTLLYPLRIGRFTYRPGFRLERQRFDSFLLGVVTEGTLHATIWADDVPHHYDVAPGHVFLFDTYLHHEGRADTLTRTSMIHFDGAPARTYYERITASSGNVFPIDNPAALENTIDGLLDAYSSGSGNIDLIGARVLTDLLTDLAIRRTPGESDALSAVRETLTFLAEHYAEDVTVDALARRAMMSSRQYLRKFKALTGTTPYAKLTGIRMDHARELLTRTTQPVRQIAKSVGYPNPNAFTTAFKKSVGMTPARYRSIESDTGGDARPLP
ncbi:helix-turn-helix transcriptional regulator [Bifidobacterium sp. CP2]|uniref:AraC family transcriptional regulator n=1 Tax=Bifidobacterium sp. CP2 TaxID=2809025 RepID=UPI001BDBC794|nr:AraC family transcriptional regulator [Bifidobacterium sp. CP2]MBT1180823.1 helix-turn-helix transcriptional regulator [Bifidobacterium sp. CP2]